MKNYLQQRRSLLYFLVAHLIAIVDVYDVLIHDRTYKQKMSQQEALQELERCAGTQFDPNLICIFLDNAYYITNSILILAFFLLC